MPWPTSEKQGRFACMVALLILHASMLGYRVTLGEAWRPDDKRCHGMKLAIDLNLFLYHEESGRWVYVRTVEPHRPLGEYWESIGGSWGGRFESGDANHYSVMHGGIR